MTDAICKGAWVLNSNCKRCARCLETAPEYIEHLRDQLHDFQTRVFNAVCILPPDPMRVGDKIARYEPPRPVDLLYSVKAALLKQPEPPVLKIDMEL